MLHGLSFPGETRAIETAAGPVGYRSFARSG
jgi:hypothetical protein